MFLYNVWFKYICNQINILTITDIWLFLSSTDLIVYIFHWANSGGTESHWENKDHVIYVIFVIRHMWNTSHTFPSKGGRAYWIRSKKVRLPRLFFSTACPLDKSPLSTVAQFHQLWNGNSHTSYITVFIIFIINILSQWLIMLTEAGSGSSQIT